MLDDDIPDDAEPDEVACCLPEEEGETECEDLTADECQREGGTAPGATSCMPNPCATGPAEETRCCVPEEQEAECEDTTPAE